MSRSETTSGTAIESQAKGRPEKETPPASQAAASRAATSGGLSPFSHTKPRHLDLFCGAGGCTKGYQRAGFYVVGIDIEPQPRYCGDEFVQDDALLTLRDCLHPITWWWHFDAIHASPPCQAYSDLQNQNKREYPDLIAPVRELLRATGLPYVIENVPEAPLLDPVILCGTMFDGLRVIRHRGFESNFRLSPPPVHPKHPLVFTHDKRKAHHGKLDQDTSFVQVTGGGNCTVANKRDAMGVYWMTGAEANEAIPPAYAEYVGRHLLAHVREREAELAA